MAQFAAAAGGSLLSGIAAGKGAKKAAEIQAQSQANALAEQQREYNTNQANFAPYMQAGNSALTAQTGLLGLDGADQQQSAITALQGSPLFTSLDQSGTDALLQAAAATGGLRGGNTESALYNNRSQLLANVIQNQLSNLGNVSQLGVGAATTAGNLGQAASGNISNILTQGGQQQASYALAGAAGTQKTFNGLTDALQQYLNQRSGISSSGYNAFTAPVSGAALTQGNSPFYGVQW